MAFLQNFCFKIYDVKTDYYYPFFKCIINLVAIRANPGFEPEQTHNSSVQSFLI